MSFTAPVIEADGSITEAKLSRPILRWRRNRVPPRIVRPEQKNVTHFGHDDFILTGFAFRLDAERVVKTEVYVSTQFKCDMTDEDRIQAIREVVYQYYPWFYSYGSRVVEEKEETNVD